MYGEQSVIYGKAETILDTTGSVVARDAFCCSRVVRDLLTGVSTLSRLAGLRRGRLCRRLLGLNLSL